MNWMANKSCFIQFDSVSFNIYLQLNKTTFYGEFISFSLCASDEPLFISMLAPFLRYLYCEPQRLPENALLRHGLLRVLLQHREVTQGHASACARVTHQILHCLFNLFPHILVSILKCGYELFYCLLEILERFSYRCCF